MDTTLSFTQRLPSQEVSVMLASDLDAALREVQRRNETRFAKKHIDGLIAQAIDESDITQAKVEHGVQLINDWLALEHYEAKQQRLAQLDPLCIETMVKDVFKNIAYYQVPTLFVSVTAQLALNMGFSDHRDSILTMAEVVAVLCNADAYDITKDTVQSSLMVKSRLHLPEEVLDAIARSMYLPPMICKPKPVASNFESPYLTFNDSAILGKNNSHGGDICLDVINTQNSIAMKLDYGFLTTVEEQPTHELNTQDKLNEWNSFKRTSYGVYELLAKQGNKFYLTNKVDKRGRLYSQGYHVTSQGSAFKKAMLELHHEELVTGVPE